MKPLFGFSILLLFVQFLPAQTANSIDNLLKTGEVSCGQALIFIIEAAQQNAGPAVKADFSEKLMEELGKDSRFRQNNTSPITLGGLSLLVMKAFDLRGGIFYSLFPNDRYAYRELVFKKVIEGRADPTQRVSGETFLYVLGQISLQLGD
ncbi:MAG: hypothetical protein LBQ88_16215 [Treponema sp.]|jgi:hypothetical protein|nr:hypothetical protein [Treponema sp.]